MQMVCRRKVSKLREKLIFILQVNAISFEPVKQAIMRINNDPSSWPIIPFNTSSMLLLTIGYKYIWQCLLNDTDE